MRTSPRKTPYTTFENFSSTDIDPHIRRVAGNVCYADGHAELRKQWYDAYHEEKFAVIYHTNADRTGKWKIANH